MSTQITLVATSVLVGASTYVLAVCSSKLTHVQPEMRFAAHGVPLNPSRQGVYECRADAGVAVYWNMRGTWIYLLFNGECVPECQVEHTWHSGPLGEPRYVPKTLDNSVQSFGFYLDENVYAKVTEVTVFGELRINLPVDIGKLGAFTLPRGKEFKPARHSFTVKRCCEHPDCIALLSGMCECMYGNCNMRGDIMKVCITHDRCQVYNCPVCGSRMCQHCDVCPGCGWDGSIQ